MEEPQDKENAVAGLLTGIMFSLLGGAFPTLLMWFAATHWASVISSSRTMTSVETIQGVGLLAVSLPILRYGVKMVMVNAKAFRRL